MKPLNSYIVCKDIEDNTNTTESGFEVKSQKRFKLLQVIASSDEDVKENDVVKVSVSAGEPDGEYLIIKRADIIYIV